MRVFETPDARVAALVEHIGEASRSAIASTGRFSFVATGGNTVIPVYQRLCSLDTNWQAWHVSLSDERCVPVDSMDRNSSQIRDVWLSKVPIPEVQIQLIPAELGSDDGADLYSRQISGNLPFDMVLLTIGTDGHVASIFPGDDVEPDKAPVSLVKPVHSAPRPCSERISLTLECLAASHQVALLAVGAEKRSALRNMTQRVAQPAAQLASLTKLDVWADIAAAGSQLCMGSQTAPRRSGDPKQR